MSGIGSMRDQIVVNKPIRLQQPGGGGTTAWTTIANCWTQVTNITSRKGEADSESVLIESFQFKIRSLPELITVDYQIQWNGVLYSVTSVEDIGNRHYYWLIKCGANERQS